MNMPDNIQLVLVCGGFGLAVLALAVSSLREAAAMKKWPVAKGRVLSSKVEEYRADAGSGNFGGPRGRMTLYRPVVSYEYEVGGQRYEGKRIAQSEGMNKGVADFAEATVKRYAGGSAVDVRFNPKRPGECVLEPRVPKAWVVVVAIGIGLVILAVYLYKTDS